MQHRHRCLARDCRRQRCHDSIDAPFPDHDDSARLESAFCEQVSLTNVARIATVCFCRRLDKTEKRVSKTGGGLKEERHASCGLITDLGRLTCGLPCKGTYCRTWEMPGLSTNFWARRSANVMRVSTVRFLGSPVSHHRVCEMCHVKMSRRKTAGLSRASHHSARRREAWLLLYLNSRTSP